jgi:hypothetical protein
MSFEDITIYRDIPIIDDRVAKPPNNPVEYNSIDTVSDPNIVRLTIGSGKNTGSKFGAQEFIRLTGIAPDEWYATDPLAGL